MKIHSQYLVKAGKKFDLADVTTDDKGEVHGHAAKHLLQEHRERLEQLQDVLYAGQQKAVLMVVQGMDTAGKDGTIRHIFSGVNPQGCVVASFKVPTALEERHDFLWRVHAQVPPRGMIGIFNRSHYEDVLSPRVHGVISKKEVKQRLEQIRSFEAGLVEAGVVILKFFLHISKEEQGKRLQARIDDPDKHWKLSEGDFHERRFWDDYQEAYADLLGATSTEDAPWFVIPADHKKFRNLAISGILVDALGGLALSYPKSDLDVSTLKV